MRRRREGEETYGRESSDYGQGCAPYVVICYAFEGEYIFAIDKVCYVGQPIAAVAALDEDIAEEALSLIEVEYEELPAVFDAEEAILDGAPFILSGD
jgi:CO/xanthine dehydrogenase Mo-binding subunit